LQPAVVTLFRAPRRIVGALSDLEHFRGTKAARAQKTRRTRQECVFCRRQADKTKTWTPFFDSAESKNALERDEEKWRPVFGPHPAGIDHVHDFELIPSKVIVI
jgi:hypothetical protein